MSQETTECKGRINMTFPFYGYYVPDGDRIRLGMVAVYPAVRRRGHFARLIKELKANYNTIEMPVPLGDMKQVLERWGFVKHTSFDEELFEDVSVMIWTRESKQE